MKKYKVFTLKNVQAANFMMTPLELKEYIDFDVKRIYFISKPQNAKNTGQHAPDLSPCCLCASAVLVNAAR